MNKTDIDPIRSIPTFYAGQSIFLTGATGFLGKAFVEKVLRSCQEVREIFLLIRPKKGLSAVERLEKMLSLSLFDKLRDEQPFSFKKLIPIPGDASEKGLGLMPADMQVLIERVTIIVHGSASVKFNESMKYAILANTRSTRDICVLAESMRNLVALVYVSTAFAQTDHCVIEEKVYPSKADWRKTIEIVESLNEHSLKIFTAKYMGNAVNTYVFSKNLAEGVIQDYSTSLPCVIFRPTMVMPALSEPYPGWTDNINGPTGLFIAIGKGIIHTIYSNKEVCHDWIPIDATIKSLLQVIWKCSATTITPGSAPLVFNCSSGTKKITHNENWELGKAILREFPYEDSIWTLSGTLTNSYTVFYITTMLWQIIPALIMDLVLKCSNRRPMFLNLQRKIYMANCALGYYSTNEWLFDNTNTMILNETVPPDNEEEFKFHWKDVDRKEFLKIAILGTKKFLLHEDISQTAINAAKAHVRRLKLFVGTFKTCVAVGVLWAVYQWKIFLFILSLLQLCMITYL